MMPGIIFGHKLNQDQNLCSRKKLFVFIKTIRSTNQILFICDVLTDKQHQPYLTMCLANGCDFVSALLVTALWIHYS